MAKLSAFADEVTEDFRGQVEYLTQEKVGYIEPRFINKKNIMDLNQGELKEARQMLRDHGLKVSAIGSPIGKIGIDEPFEPHLADFGRAIQLAELFDCRHIRVFSFYVPEGRADAYRAQVMERLGALLDRAKGHPVVLLHENERRIYGDIPRRCLDILETFASPQLRMTFDPANFVFCDVRPFTDGYEMLKDYIDYLHIKDVIADGLRIVPAGEGDAQVREVLSALQARGYDGFASLEPHLSEAGPFKGYSGPDLFGVAAKALKDVLAEIGQP